MKSLIIWQKCHKVKDYIIKVLCYRKKNVSLLLRRKKINLLKYQEFYPHHKSGLWKSKKLKQDKLLNIIHWIKQRKVRPLEVRRSIR